MQGTVNTGTSGSLTAYDLERALKAYPDDKILAFVDGSQALQTGGTLADQMQRELLAENEEKVCSIAVTYGQMGL